MEGCSLVMNDGYNGSTAKFNHGVLNTNGRLIGNGNPSIFPRPCRDTCRLITYKTPRHTNTQRNRDASAFVPAPQMQHTLIREQPQLRSASFLSIFDTALASNRV